MSSKSDLLTPFRKNIVDGQNFLNSLRAFNEAYEASRTPPADASVLGLLGFYLGKALRFVGRELLYAAWIPLLILLQIAAVIACNLIGLALLWWLLGLF